MSGGRQGATEAATTSDSAQARRAPAIGACGPDASLSSKSGYPRVASRTRASYLAAIVKGRTHDQEGKRKGLTGRAIPRRHGPWLLLGEITVLPDAGRSVDEAEQMRAPRNGHAIPAIFPRRLVFWASTEAASRLRASLFLSNVHLRLLPSHMAWH